MPFVYILRCADDTFYVGHTDDLATRTKTHQLGLGAGYTAARLPVRVVYSEECPSHTEALHREHQLKRWSGRKKEARIAGDLESLKRLSRRRQPKRTAQIKK